MENVAIQSFLLKDFVMVKPGGEAAFLEGQEKMFQQLLERMFQEPAEKEEHLPEMLVVDEESPPQESASFDESVYQALQHFLRFPPEVKRQPESEMVVAAVENHVQTEKDKPGQPDSVRDEVEVPQVFVERVAEKPTNPVNHPVEQEETPFQLEPVKEIIAETIPPQTTEERNVAIEVTAISSAPITLEARPTISTTPKVETVEINWPQPEPFVREVGQTMEITLGKMQPNEVKVVQVKLAPESFGEMEIRLEWEGDRVEAKIFVQQEDVKHVLEEQMPKLLEQLPSEPVVRQISIEIMPQALFQHFMGQSGTRKQATTDKHGYRTDQSAEEDGEEQEEARNQLQGLSLYI